MSRPICPFCLGKHDFKQSRECPNSHQEADPDLHEEVPQTYIDQYDEVPPLWLLTAGFSKHGKTTYLTALISFLEAMTRVWEDFCTSYFDPISQKMIIDMRNQVIHGTEPPKTKQAVPRPMLFNVLNIPPIGSRCMVVYDIAGETFENLKSIENEGYIHCLKEVKNIWFFISLTDLENKSHSINDLINVYLNGMKRMKWSLQGRNLIVVYTKADLILSGRNEVLNELIREYFISDPFYNITNYSVPPPSLSEFDFDSYILEMQAMSDKLEKYTRESVPSGGSFINLVRKQNHMGLYFTVTSALGTGPVDGRIRIDEAIRYRILDPFFWAIYLSQAYQPQNIRLVLDAQVSGDFHNNPPFLRLAEKLDNLGEVTTFYLGQTRPVTDRTLEWIPGQSISDYPHLIGPIIANMALEEWAIVFTGKRIIDLDDYFHSSFKDHVLIVNLSETEFSNWEHQLRLSLNGKELEDLLIEIYDYFSKTFFKE